MHGFEHLLRNQYAYILSGDTVHLTHLPKEQAAGHSVTAGPFWDPPTYRPAVLTGKRINHERVEVEVVGLLPITLFQSQIKELANRNDLGVEEITE